MRITLVGAGVISLLTAVECVLAGHHVTVVDQGDIPFSGATSFDRHRIIRALHRGDPRTTEAAVRAHHRWMALERLLTTRFYHRVGALTVLPTAELAGALSMLRSSGTQGRVLHAEQLATRCPYVSFPAGAEGVLESDAGVLLADRALAACVGWLRGHARVELVAHQAVVGVNGRTASVRLVDGDVIDADAAIVATGPWSRRLLPPEVAAELTLYRQSLLYCRVPDQGLAAWSTTPAIPSLGTSGGAWLVPPVAGTPLKLSAASACRVVDEIADRVTGDSWRDHLVEVFDDLISDFRPDWVTDTRDCYYLAHTATGGSLLVALGETVYCYAACGGSSFKFAPLIAGSLAQRATGLRPTPVGLGPLDQQPLLPAAIAHV